MAVLLCGVSPNIHPNRGERGARRLYLALGRAFYCNLTGEGHAVRAESHEVVVVGGGIAGLAAAWALRDRDVVLLEESDRVGGRIFAQARDPYWLNFGAHLIGFLDTPMGRLAKEVGAEAIPVKGELAAVWMNGRLVRGGRIESYPFRLAMPLAARLSLMCTGLRLRRANTRALRHVDDPVHGDYEYPGDVVEVGGDAALDARSFADVLGPMHADVAALLRSATNRLTAEPVEMSGHFGAAFVGSLWNLDHLNRHIIRGGMTRIVNGLAERLGNRITTGAAVNRIVPGDGGATVHANQGGEELALSARHVIVATPAPVTRGIVEGLPADEAAALDSVRYGPFVVMAVRTNETGPMTYDDIYAVLVAGRSACMIFNSMSPLRAKGAAREPGGALMMYAGGWRAAELMGRSDEDVRDTFLADLHAVLPETRGFVAETVVHRWQRGFPYWPPGRLARQEALARPHRNLHFAGDYLEYPSTDPASRTGLLAARNVRALLEGA